MKPLRTPLTPLRRRRAEAVILAYGSEVSLRTFRDLCRRRPNAIFEMLTDEAIEAWAFTLMENRVSTNRMNARNRAINAARQPVTAS